MAWKEWVIKVGKKDVPAYQRGNEISCPDVFGDVKVSSIIVDGKTYPVQSSGLDDRGESITITLELPNGSAKEKGEPDGESNEVASRDTARQ